MNIYQKYQNILKIFYCYVSINKSTFKNIRLFKQNNISHINLCNYVFLQKTFIVDLISDYIVPDSFVIFLII